MVDSSVIYNVVVNFKTNTGQKATKIMEGVNKQTAKTGKIFTGLNKTFQMGSIRLFSLVFMLRRMRDAVGGLLVPAAQMSGIMDVWNMTLGLFFLPIMMAILPIVLQFSDWLLSLPEPMQIAVGALALLALAVLSVSTWLALLAVGMAAIGKGDLTSGVGVITKSLSNMVPNLIAATGATTAWGAALKLAIAGTIIVGIIMLLFWLDSVQKKMGGWIPFFENVAKGIMRVFVLIGAGIAGAFAAAWDLVKSGWNGFVSFLENGLNKIIGWLNDLINSFNAVTGASVKTITNANFGGAKASTVGVGNAFNNTFGDIMGAYFDWEQSHLSTPSIDQVALSAADQSKLSQINAMKSSGMDNASIINSMSGLKSSSSPSVVVNQTNNIDVADWTKYEQKMAEQQRKMEADLKRQLAAGQV